jgi:hypothetical protein
MAEFNVTVQAMLIDVLVKNLPRFFLPRAPYDFYFHLENYFRIHLCFLLTKFLSIYANQ